LNEALVHISKRMDIPIRRWISSSEVLKDYLRQRRIDDYA
jgi:hypothetical protein